eukprot:m51a1_g6610 hypothetical protein (422) ;mRNA; f:18109-19729
MADERQPLLDSDDDTNPHVAAADRSAEARVAELVGAEFVERLKSRCVRDFADGLERLRTVVLAQFARELEAELRRAGAQAPRATPQPAPTLATTAVPLVSPSAPVSPMAASVKLSTLQQTAGLSKKDESASDVVGLNVGGVSYITSRKTLLSIPETYFHALLDSVPQEDGKFFIDRDGAHFGNVLNYLRDKEAVALPRDEEVRRRLLVEARYYGLNGLARALNSSLFNDAAKASLSLSPRSTSGILVPPLAAAPGVVVPAPMYVPTWDEDRKHSSVSVYGVSVVRGGSKNDDAVALAKPAFPTTGVHRVTYYVAKKPKRSCYYFGLVKAQFKDYSANLSTHRWAWVYDDVGAVSCNSIQMGMFAPIGTGSRLELVVDMDRQSLTFVANGKKQTSVFLPKAELVPAVSLYNPGSEVCFSIDT